MTSARNTRVEQVPRSTARNRLGSHNLYQLGMAHEYLVGRAEDSDDLVLGCRRVGARHGDATEKSIGEQAEKLVFGSDIPIKRGGANATLPCQAAHRHALDTVGFDNCRYGVDEILERQPGSFRSLGAGRHCPIIRPSQTLSEHVR